MSLKVGDTLPEINFTTPSEAGPKKVSVTDLCKGRKLVLFAVPGAFTPTCHGNHLPGFLKLAKQIKDKGVEGIAVIAVNDVFVMKAWREATNAGHEIMFLADGSAQFTKAVDMVLDATDAGLGIRSKRYAMIVDNGVVTTLNVEDSPAHADASGAEHILEAL